MYPAFCFVIGNVIGIFMGVIGCLAMFGGN